MTCSKTVSRAFVRVTLAATLALSASTATTVLDADSDLAASESIAPPNVHPPGEQRPAGRSIRDFPRLRLFNLAESHGGTRTLSLDRRVLLELGNRRDRFVVEDFPIGRDESIELQLRPFRVAGDNTRFVLGRKNGPDIPLTFDPSSIALFTGTVANHPGSDVFLALSETLSAGRIHLGPGRPTYRLSSQTGKGRPTAAGQVAIFPATAPAMGIDVPLCGIDGVETDGFRLGEVRGEPASSVASTGPDPIKGMRTIELAVETDFEYFELFGDADAASAYVTALIGAVSQIYMREASHRYELTFVRIWDTPDDLFNQPNGFDAFFAFGDYWQANMGAVQRDAAQYMSGRRDLPFGGVAYLSAICSVSSGYSMIGYLLGFFPDPAVPSVYHYDIEVSAHELGHNCGSLHTDAYVPPIDRCYPPPSIVQRGTIMSYCSQAVSGGNAVHEMRFHARVQAVMTDFLSGRPCVIDDCNMNDVPDVTDIFALTSPDVNGNGIPDECEDCDGNGELDPTDISQGVPDVNGNGIPDLCEPDCNGNGVPDDRDILLGTSTDAYGNNIPDQCEADCNGNLISDFTEIQADLTLDINRNAILDACEDCNGDGTTDADELNGAYNAWIASDLLDVIGEYHADTGVLVKNAASGWLADPQDVVITETGRIFVSSALDDRVVEFNRAGSYVGDFVSTGSGGLDYPTGLLLRPNGNLLVSSRDTSSVIEYDGATGALVGSFVDPFAGGLSSPFGLALGPNGNLFVAGGNNQVTEYDGQTGAFVGVFVTAAGNGGLLNPRGMAFKPDGNLLVAGFSSDAVYEYDGGTGAFLRIFHNGGTVYGPWGVRIGPNGNVFLTRDYVITPGSREGTHGGTEPLHATTTRIYEYDPVSGNHLRSYVLGDDTGLSSPTGFAFMPGAPVDCNANLVLDSCDIALGTSQDVDGNGTPDECQCLPSAAPQAQTLALPGNPDSLKDRFISIKAGDPGRIQAIRVKPVNLPPPYDQWDCSTGSCRVWYAGEPRVICENAGQATPPPCVAERCPDDSSCLTDADCCGAAPGPTKTRRWNWFAPLVCDEALAHFMDWRGRCVSGTCVGGLAAGGTCLVDDDCQEFVHLYHDYIVPSRMATPTGPIDDPAVYDIQVVGGACSMQNDSNYSPPLTMTQAAWGDVVLDVAQCPNGPPNERVDVVADVIAVVNKFANLPCAVKKARADLEPANVDFIINITDVLQCIGAFAGDGYPFGTGQCANGSCNGGPDDGMACATDADCRSDPCAAGTARTDVGQKKRLTTLP